MDSPTARESCYNEDYLTGIIQDEKTASSLTWTDFLERMYFGPTGSVQVHVIVPTIFGCLKSYLTELGEMSLPLETFQKIMHHCAFCETLIKPRKKVCVRNRLHSCEKHPKECASNNTTTMACVIGKMHSCKKQKKECVSNGYDCVFAPHICEYERDGCLMETLYMKNTESPHLHQMALRVLGGLERGSVKQWRWDCIPQLLCRECSTLRFFNLYHLAPRSYERFYIALKTTVFCPTSSSRILPKKGYKNLNDIQNDLVKTYLMLLQKMNTTDSSLLTELNRDIGSNMYHCYNCRQEKQLIRPCLFCNRHVLCHDCFGDTLAYEYHLLHQCRYLKENILLFVSDARYYKRTTQSVEKIWFQTLNKSAL